MMRLHRAFELAPKLWAVLLQRLNWLFLFRILHDDCTGRLDGVEEREVTSEFAVLHLAGPFARKVGFPFACLRWLECV